MMRRVVAAAVLAVVGALALSGCGEKSLGLVSIARDDQGELQALIAMCDGHVDSVVVYDSGKVNGRTLGTWALADPVTDTGTLALPGLEVVMKDDGQYAIRGASDDDSSLAQGVDFNKSTVESLASGQVFGSDFTIDPAVDGLMSIETWQESVDAFCKQ